MRRVVFGAALGLSLMAMGKPAFAHAHLVGSEPAADASVRAAPDEVTLRFSEGVEAAFSKVEIKGADGKDVALGKLATNPGDKKILHAKPTEPLVPGAYTVLWQATSVDTHKTKGSFGFKIAP